MLQKEDHNFFCPNYFFSEIFKYKEKILTYSNLDESELHEYLIRILDRIQFTRYDFISRENRQTALELCKNIDEKDTPFVALALELDAKVWTGDKKLITGLKEKGFSKIVDFSDGKTLR